MHRVPILTLHMEAGSETRNRESRAIALPSPCGKDTLGVLMARRVRQQKDLENHGNKLFAAGFVFNALVLQHSQSEEFVGFGPSCAKVSSFRCYLS